jgi:D-amino-acid dehydrogenase
LRKDAPLLLNLRPSYHKYSWLAEFCGHIRNYRANTIETTKMAIAAREYLFRIASEEKIDFDLKQLGILHMYYNKKAFDTASQANRLLRDGGLDRFPVTPHEMRKLEPALNGEFYGGFYTPSDATGDIHKFTRGLADACRRLGASFDLGVTVDDLTTSADGVTLSLSRGDSSQPKDTLVADAVLVCAGVSSRDFASMLGDRINIYPVKGYSITVMLNDDASQNAAPNVSLLDEDAKIVTSRLGPTRFRVAGTAEFNGMNRDIRADRIAPLVKWCEQLFPAMATSAVVPWAGLRPMTPSMLPRVGRGRRDRVFYNTGHGHLGWTLSAATSTVVAEQISQRFS